MGRKCRLIDMTGLKFGELVVLRREGMAYGHQATWRCRCSCGEEVTARGGKLRSGAHKTCRRNGHSWSRVLAATPREPGVKERFPSEYRSWQHMHYRCASPKSDHFVYYGARGISVCEEWGSFAGFLEDMGPKPTPQHTIERNDVDGNYEPGNCRWATKEEQRRNMRCSVYVEIDGEKRLLLDVCAERGISRGVVYGRLKNGWDLETALTTPHRARAQPAAPINIGEVHRLYHAEGLWLKDIAKLLGQQPMRVSAALKQAEELLGE